MDALILHRLQFAFTVTYHYLFPQLTVGLSFLIFLLLTLDRRSPGRGYKQAARYWTKIFGVAFVFGVVTGIPLEFEFGTNWSQFSAKTGGVVGQPLAMEGVFAFFLESSFLYVLLYGEKRVGERLHWLSSLLLWLGTWASAYFIVSANAWMQHPVGYEVAADGTFGLVSIQALLTNPWARSQLAHTLVGAVITACFVMGGTGAFYLLRRVQVTVAKRFLSVAVVVGCVATLMAAFPTGDMEARKVLKHQPVAFAAMEGQFETEAGAGLVMMGQPDTERQGIDNPLVLPRVLSLMAYQDWGAEVRGLREFPEHDWPDNIPLLFFAYHIMAGLGTLFIGVMGISAVLLWRRKLFDRPWALWMLLLFVPLPFVANTMGWMTTELGRQPWLVYGLLRTEDGASDLVSSGNAMMSILGFAGLYTLMSVLITLVVARIVRRGPDAPASQPPVEEV